MRSVLSISLPAKQAAALKRRAKSKGMTISAYALKVFQQDEYLISEEELLKDIEQNRKDLKAGKCRVMSSNDRVEDFFPLEG